MSPTQQRATGADDRQPSWQDEIARAVIGFALAAAVVLLFRGEQGVRFGGGLLLMFGGYAVLKGFWDLRRDFRLPLARVEIALELEAVAGQLQRDVRRLFRLAPEAKSINVAAGGIAIGGSSVSARASLGFDTTLPIETRVSNLEKRHQQLEVALGQAEDRLASKIRAMESGLTAERSEREAARQSVLDRMEVVMTGGLRFQIVGLIWLLGGTVLASCAPELGAIVR